MSYVDGTHAVLYADSTLTALLTGGIYNGRSVGMMGINRQSIPAAFNSTAPYTLKPCLIVKGRARVPFGGIRDTAYASVRQVIMLYFYADGDTAYTVLEQARERVFTLLDNKQIQPASQSNQKAFRLQWFNGIDDEREAALNNALMERDDYAAIGMATGA